MAKQSTKASPLPMWGGVASLALSIVLAALPSLKIVENSDWRTSLVGWALTPVISFTLYGLDYYLQHRATNSPAYTFRSGFTTVLKVLAYVSLVLCVIHVWRLADLWSVVQ